MDHSHIDTKSSDRYFLAMYWEAVRTVKEHNTPRMDPQMLRDFTNKRNQTGGISTSTTQNKKKKDKLFIPYLLVKNHDYHLNMFPKRLSLEKIAIIGNVDSPLSMLVDRSFGVKIDELLSEKYSKLTKDQIGVYLLLKDNEEFTNGKKLYIIGSRTNNPHTTQMAGSKMETEDTLVGIVGNFKKVLKYAKAKPLIYTIHTDTEHLYGLWGNMRNKKFHRDVV